MACETREEDWTVYQWVLDQSPLGATGETYLRNRGISQDTIARFRVGQLGSVESLLVAAVDVWGLKHVKASGLISNASTHSRLLYDFSDNQIVFPFFRSGRCEFLQARRIDDVQRFRWVNPRNIVKRLFNLDALSSANPADPIYLCEGVTDVLSAHELGWTAIGVVGVRSPRAEWLPLFRNRDIRILFDDDGSGRRMAVNFQHQFDLSGLNATSQSIPAGKDLNEYLLHKIG